MDLQRGNDVSGYRSAVRDRGAREIAGQRLGASGLLLTRRDRPRERADGGVGGVRYEGNFLGVQGWRARWRLRGV